MTTSSPERSNANYVEALMQMESVWAKCQEIAAECHISTNEVIAIAITELHSRMIDIKEGRLLISVNASDARFYTSTLDMHLTEASPVYRDVLERLGDASPEPAMSSDIVGE